MSAFADLVDGPLRALTDRAAPLGAEVADATALFASCFEAELAVLRAVAACAKPSAEALSTLLAPVGAALTALADASAGRRTDAFNHLKALAEASQALSFVAFQGPDMGMSAPAAHVAEAWQSAEFWTNKIRTQHKATNPEHVAWVDALRDLVARDVREYVKTHHPAGPAWNPKGGDVKTYEASGAGATTVAVTINWV